MATTTERPCCTPEQEATVKALLCPPGMHGTQDDSGLEGLDLSKFMLFLQKALPLILLLFPKAPPVMHDADTDRPPGMK